ncbi:MAG: NUDIX domain-containing protein [Candidatus Woesebacteria bacterium]
MTLEKGIDCIGITVTFFCHDGKGNFVMAKRGQKARDENGRWDVGGGAVEWGSTVEETLKTEIKEEYSADILSSEFLGYEDIFRENKGRKTHWLSLFFKVLVNPAQVKNGEPHKFDDLQWFTFDSLPPKKELHSQAPLFFTKYRDRLR